VADRPGVLEAAAVLDSDITVAVESRDRRARVLRRKLIAPRELVWQLGLDLELDRHQVVAAHLPRAPGDDDVFMSATVADRRRASITRAPLATLASPDWFCCPFVGRLRRTPRRTREHSHRRTTASALAAPPPSRASSIERVCSEYGVGGTRYRRPPVIFLTPLDCRWTPV
jgi:hypothetical protein